MEIRENGEIILSSENENLNFSISKLGFIFHMTLYNCTNFNIWKYKESADFQRAIFLGEAAFADEDGGRSAEFAYDANYAKSLFNSDAVFSGVRFNNNAHFVEAKFNRTANFKGTEFGGYAQFSEARFNETADFGNAILGGCVIFRNNTYNETANFNGIQFLG
jgi:hypothetical protein